MQKGKSHGGVVLVNMAVQTQVEASPSTGKPPSKTEVESKGTHLPSNANPENQSYRQDIHVHNNDESTCVPVAADSV